MVSNNSVLKEEGQNSFIREGPFGAVTDTFDMQKRSLENGALIEFQWPPPASSAIIHTHLQRRTEGLRNTELGVMFPVLVTFNINAEEGPNSDIELEEEAREPDALDDTSLCARGNDLTYVQGVATSRQAEARVIARMMNRFSLCADDAPTFNISVWRKTRTGLNCVVYNMISNSNAAKVGMLLSGKKKCCFGHKRKEIELKHLIITNLNIAGWTYSEVNSASG